MRPGWKIVSWTIFCPLAFLVYLFWQAHPGFHSDDVGYWLVALQWQRLFEYQPFGSALHAIFSWPSSRPTFHPLLGIPALWIFRGSIDGAMIFVGLIFSLLISASLFMIFRRSGLSRNLAALSTLAVATFPHFLSQGRFFMAEYPFAAFCLCALAFLLSGRYIAFSLLYALALLERPLEGSLLLPAFFLFGFFQVPDAQLSRGQVALAVAGAWAVTALAYAGRADSFLPWISRTAFSQNGFSVWRSLGIGAGTVHFIGKSVFCIYGFTGGAIILVAGAAALRNGKRNPRNAIGYFGIFAVLIAVLFLISRFDNGATIEASWRYTLTFVLFLFLAAILQLARFIRAGLATALVAGFLAANILVLGTAFGGEEFWARGPWSGSVRYHRAVIRSEKFPYGVTGVVEGLAGVLPRPIDGILFVGQSDVLFDRRPEIELRCAERLHVACAFAIEGDPFRAEILKREIRAGGVDLSRYGIDAVVLARGKVAGDSSRKPYPGAELLDVFARHGEGKLGLKKLGEIPTPFKTGPKVLEVYGRR